MMQWIPTASGSEKDEKELFRAFSDVFPHTTMWWQTSGGCALLLGSREPLQIDYQHLRKHWKEPRVTQDMLLSDVRDADHFLSLFVFDDQAFADFVHDSRPTQDGHTVLDFSMPRYVGSGFGLGQFNRNAKEDGHSPFFFVRKRRLSYAAQKRSVLPYLTNFGTETVEENGARIDASADLKFRKNLFQEKGWRRMRADGTLPANWNSPTPPGMH